MIENYKSEVMRLYEEKKAKGELSTNLIHYTPANIRNEVRLLIDIYDKSDKGILKDFFNISYDKDLFSSAINWADIGKFKPLCNFLRIGNNVNMRTIELLAWLIDFNPRPFSKYWRYGVKLSVDASDLSLIAQLVKL
jgi:hypothetical protein